MNLSVIGLGYVGLPLSVAFSKKTKVTGFDINKKRIKDLKKKIDKNNEIDKIEFNSNLNFTNNLNDLKKSNIFIICVPTPVYKNNKPNLKYVIEALQIISKVINKGSLIILESTVYPGTTRKLINNVLGKAGYILNKDFYVGYSPERINPGDKVNSLEKITKIVSTSSITKKNQIIKLYKLICKKVHYTNSIEEAEAAKVIENVQRDINIALMNELWTLFNNYTDLDYNRILKAAATKWNFLNFKPGLVGGHCIPVDPYYLADYAKENNFDTKFILKSRSINNNFYKELINNIKSKHGKEIKKFNCLILGITYKKNVSDIRNTQAIDFIRNLSKYVKKIEYFDPYCNEFDEKLINKTNCLHLKNIIPNKKKYDLIIELVEHNYFIENKDLIINMIKNKKNYFKI